MKAAVSYWAITNGDPDLLTDPVAPMRIPVVAA